MLTLITGLPGNGKTLYALQYVDAWSRRENRPVYYHGVKGLKPDLGWHEIPVVVEKFNGRELTVPQWWLCPIGAIILIDEAQMCGFGVRPRGVVPEWGQKLEVHRHLGLDVVFITQDPKLIDSHDRSLMELHFHVMRTFGMQRATVHEFRPVRDNIKSRAGSIQHKWKFPKSVFDWYVSAELHTHKARIPMKVWVLAAVAVLVPALAWLSWVKYLDPKRERAPLAGAVVAPVGAQSQAAKVSKLTVAEYVKEQEPRIRGLSYSAPVYDDVTKPIEAPYPAACIKMGKRCGCYSQQATKLDVPSDMCLAIVDGGYFVSWQLPVAKAVPLQVRQEIGPAPVGGAAGFGVGLPVSAGAFGDGVASGRRGGALPKPSASPQG